LETTKLPAGKDKIYQFLVYETVRHRPPPLTDSRLTNRGRSFRSRS
jgi:hypothetical protein